LIGDLTAGNTSIYNGIPGYAFYYTAQHLYSGPNYLAPQGTFQSDKQIRYDGSWTVGRHNIRYGYSLNRILGGGFAAFFGLPPRTAISSSTLFSGPTSTNPNALGCGGGAGPQSCPGDPLNGYFPSPTYLGNGQGFFTEHSGFGLPGGGVEDWRQGAYLADTWKVTPSFTLTAGLRWSVDTDRANQDLPTPLCSTVDPSLQFPGCTGNTPLFDQYGSTTGAGSAGYGNIGYRTRQPYGNFGPQLGFVA